VTADSAAHPQVLDCLRRNLSPRSQNNRSQRWQAGCGAQGRLRPEHRSWRGSDGFAPARRYLKRPDPSTAGLSGSLLSQTPA